MRMSAYEHALASGQGLAWEQVQAPVLEREQARRRLTQVLASVREYPPVVQRADSELQLPEVSKAPLKGAT